MDEEMVVLTGLLALKHLTVDTNDLGLIEPDFQFYGIAIYIEKWIPPDVCHTLPRAEAEIIRNLAKMVGGATAAAALKSSIRGSYQVSNGKPAPG